MLKIKPLSLKLFDTVGNRFLIVAGLFSLGVTAGYFFGWNLAKYNSNKEVQTVTELNESLTTKLMSDSLGRKNWMEAQKRGLNYDPWHQDLPIVTLSNHSRSACYGGTIDGCWKTDISALPGDTIIILINFTNYTNYEMNNYAVGCNIVSSPTGKTIRINGGVKSGVERHDERIAEGLASIKLNQPQEFTLQPNAVIKDSDDNLYDIPVSPKQHSPLIRVQNIAPGDRKLVYFSIVINK